jgi:hypothetical protein
LNESKSVSGDVWHVVPKVSQPPNRETIFVILAMSTTLGGVSECHILEID